MRFQAVDFTPLLPVWSITNNFPPLLEAVQRELDGLFFCVMWRFLGARASGFGGARREFLRIADDGESNTAY